MTPKTVARVVTADPSIQMQIVAALGRCADPDAVLKLIDEAREMRIVEGADLVRAVVDAVGQVARDAAAARKKRRGEKMKAFLVDPEILDTDAVLAMSALARAAFLTMLINSWRGPEPGVLRDDDAALATVARVTREEWIAVREAVRAACDTESRPGYWVVRQPAAAFAGQQDWRAQRREDGLRGVAKEEAREAARAAHRAREREKKRKQRQRRRDGDGAVTGRGPTGGRPPPNDYKPQRDNRPPTECSTSTSSKRGQVASSEDVPMHTDGGRDGF